MKRQRGFSLVEVTVVLALVSALMIVVYSMMEQTMRTTMFNESQNDLAVMTQRAVNVLQGEMLQTRVVFEENALGASYRDALVLPSTLTVRADSLLPRVQPEALIAPDPATERYTGNAMLVARQLEPLSVMYDDDGVGATPPVEFLADRYRFQYVFLSPDTSRPFGGEGPTLDLMMASSGVYADYFQLSTMGPKCGRIVSRLIAAGLQRAWNPGEPIDNAFYALSGAVDGTFDPPIRNPKITTASVRSLLPGIRGGRVSGKMDYSVAFVPTLPRKPLPIRLPVSLYAQPVAAAPAFPGGFEVKVAGPAGNRQAMTRLVLVAHYGVKSFTAQQGFVTTAIR